MELELNLPRPSPCCFSHQDRHIVPEHRNPCKHLCFTRAAELPTNNLHNVRLIYPK